MGPHAISNKAEMIPLSFSKELFVDRNEVHEPCQVSHGVEGKMEQQTRTSFPQLHVGSNFFPAQQGTGINARYERLDLVVQSPPTEKNSSLEEIGQIFVGNSKKKDGDGVDKNIKTSFRKVLENPLDDNKQVNIGLSSQRLHTKEKRKMFNNQDDGVSTNEIVNFQKPQNTSGVGSFEENDHLPHDITVVPDEEAPSTPCHKSEKYNVQYSIDKNHDLVQRSPVSVHHTPEPDVRPTDIPRRRRSIFGDYWNQPQTGSSCASLHSACSEEKVEGMNLAPRRGQDTAEAFPARSIIDLQRINQANVSKLLEKDSEDTAEYSSHTGNLYVGRDCPSQEAVLSKCEDNVGVCVDADKCAPEDKNMSKKKPMPKKTTIPQNSENSWIFQFFGIPPFNAHIVQSYEDKELAQVEEKKNGEPATGPQEQGKENSGNNGLSSTISDVSRQKRQPARPMKAGIHLQRSPSHRTLPAPSSVLRKPSICTRRKRNHKPVIRSTCTDKSEKGLKNDTTQETDHGRVLLKNDSVDIVGVRRIFSHRKDKRKSCENSSGSLLKSRDSVRVPLSEGMALPQLFPAKKGTMAGVEKATVDSATTNGNRSNRSIRFDPRIFIVEYDDSDSDSVHRDVKSNGEERRQHQDMTKNVDETRECRSSSTKKWFTGEELSRIKSETYLESQLLVAEALRRPREIQRLTKELNAPPSGRKIVFTNPLLQCTRDDYILFEGSKELSDAIAKHLKKALIVDPHKITRDLLERGLRVMLPNIDIVSCASTKEAIKLVAGESKRGYGYHGFDIVIAEEKKQRRKKQSAEKVGESGSLMSGSDLLMIFSEEEKKKKNKEAILCKNVIDSFKQSYRPPLLIGISSTLAEECGPLIRAGADQLWGMPPPRMDMNLRNQIFIALMAKRGRSIVVLENN